MSEELESRKENLKNKLLNFFSEYHNIILVLILIFAFIIRIYFFFQTINQPLWWDESQYVEQARRLGLNLETNDIWYYRRTMFLPLFWSLFFKLGFGETTLRLTEVFFSVLIVLATYLISKEMFNKKTALIAAFGVSISRIILFETTRLLTSVPETALMLLAVYYFYKGYIKENKTKYIYLFGLFTGLAMSVRFASFLSIISFGLIFLIKEKGKIWKNKQMLGAFLLIFLILSPFFYQYYKHYPEGISDFLRHYGEVGVPKEQKQPYLGVKGIYDYFSTIPANTGIIFFIALIIGIIFLLDFIIAPDLLFKDNKIQRNLFLFLFILPPFIYHSLKSLYVEERYLLGILPVIFIISAYGLIKFYEYVKNYNKYVVSGILIILLLVSSFYVIKSANEIILAKKDSYSQVKEASLWIKENSNPNDKIISNSIPQMQYYTDRSVYYIEEKEEVIKLKPKYYIVSIYEQSAPSYYELPEKNKDKFKAVQVYF